MHLDAKLSVAAARQINASSALAQSDPGCDFMPYERGRRVIMRNCVDGLLFVFYSAILILMSFIMDIYIWLSKSDLLDAKGLLL